MDKLILQPQDTQRAIRQNKLLGYLWA